MGGGAGGGMVEVTNGMLENREDSGAELKSQKGILYYSARHMVEFQSSIHPSTHPTTIQNQASIQYSVIYTSKQAQVV